MKGKNEVPSSRFGLNEGSESLELYQKGAQKKQNEDFLLFAAYYVGESEGLKEWVIRANRPILREQGKVGENGLFWAKSET